MKILHLIIILITISLLPLHLCAQNEEQEAWLTQKASERNNVILLDPQKVIRHSTLKNASDENDWEVDHAENKEASSTGGAYRTTQNAVAAGIINAKNVNVHVPSSLTLTGNGVNILLLDSKRPRNGHVAFDKRVFVPTQDYIDKSPYTQKDTIYKNGVPSKNLHPTLVSGTMASNSINYQSAIGAAPSANIIAYDWDFADSYLAEYAANGINVACVPWGYLAGWASLNQTWYWFGKKGQTESYRFGFYSDISQKWDEITWHAPYLLVVKSAGNDNNEGPNPAKTNPSYQYWEDTLNNGNGGWQPCNGCPLSLPGNDGNNNNRDCISDIAVAKNVLTIGAVKDNPDIILDCSGRGPTDDLRIKPDLVANGETITSTTDANSDSYSDGSATGTSFAAASVAGGVALLLEEETKLYTKTKLLASTLKALLIHTAVDKGTEGPDYTYGWGLVNIAAAAKLMEDNSKNLRQIHEFLFTEEGLVINFIVKKKDAGIPLKVTICWTDPAGTPPAISIDPTDKMLVNDIDLRVIRKNDNSVNWPWMLNSSGQTTNGDNQVDNVEQVVVKDNSTGDYYVKIYPKSLSEKQVVSVIISGIDTGAYRSDVILNTNVPITDVQVEESKNTITCNNVTVSQSGNLSLVAGNVLLKTGFKVQAGGKFRGICADDFFSAFERVYPSVVFENTLSWVDRDPNDKSGKASDNSSDTLKISKDPDQWNMSYPNPCDGKFLLKLIDPTSIQTIQIFDALGRVCYRKTCCFQANENIDITKYPDGLYLVKVQWGNQTSVIKQIKKQQ